jgi:hypothetical protein
VSLRGKDWVASELAGLLDDLTRLMIPVSVLPGIGLCFLGIGVKHETIGYSLGMIWLLLGTSIGLWCALLQWSLRWRLKKGSDLNGVMLRRPLGSVSLLFFVLLSIWLVALCIASRTDPNF